MKENVLLKKSFAFSLQIVKQYRRLSENTRENSLTRQLLRSGTSIGANIEEACGAQSRRDFLHKITIAYKEARETDYWLRLLKESEYMDDATASGLLADVAELRRIMSSTIITTKRNL